MHTFTPRLFIHVEIYKLLDFIDQAEGSRKLTQGEADYLVGQAEAIVEILVLLNC